MQDTSNTHTVPYPDDFVQLFSRLRRWSWAMWLDSGGGRDTAGRYDIMVADPVCTLVTRDGTTYIKPRDGGQRASTSDPLGLLQAEIDRYAVGAVGAPFAGGAVGYFGYDLGCRLEGVRRRPSAEPEMAVGIYRWALVVDRHSRRAWLTGPDADAGLWSRLLAEPGVQGPFTTAGAPAVAMDAASYRRAFHAVQHYITEGDCYQVNLANRLSVPYRGDPLTAYAWLRAHSGGPFSAFLDLPSLSVLSLSPERFLRSRAGWVETWPIKGTRPRDADPAADRAQARALNRSAKDRAENVMIVDLLRNDLGKVCRSGSVRVPALCRLESYSTVHHLVSHVAGELAPGHRPVDLVRACLPGGSITGAPKHRAMEIIDELEGRSRGVYCGSIGYIGFDGAMDSNIAIRTATCANGEMSYWAGGGLVADSDCEAEYQETRHKARSFLDLLEADIPRPRGSTPTPE